MTMLARLRAYWYPSPPLAPTHEHYCAAHDHRWACRAPDCTKHEATDCWRRWLSAKEST